MADQQIGKFVFGNVNQIDKFVFDCILPSMLQPNSREVFCAVSVYCRAGCKARRIHVPQETKQD